MILYVVYDRKNEQVKAITRDEDLFNEFTKDIDLDRHEFAILNTKDANNDREKKHIKSIITKLEKDYSDKVLNHTLYLDEVVTEKDMDSVQFAEEEYAKLKMLIKDLTSVIDNYSISNKDKKKLKKALKILNNIKKKKNFEKAIGFDLVKKIIKSTSKIDLKKFFTLGGNKL